MSRRRVSLVLLAVAFVVMRPPPAAAHDIPTDVLVQAFVKPEGQRLNVLVRVPLRAILDVDIPKRGPGYLDLTRAEGPLREGATGWIAGSLEFYEEGSRLTNERIAAVLVSLPSDPSFRSYEEALTHIRGAPLPPNTELYWDQGMLDVWLEYPIQSPQSHFLIRPTFWRLGLGVRMTLLFLPVTGASHAFALGGDPGLIALDPSRPQAGRRFLESGLLHVMEGAGQLLFLLCLVIPIRRLPALIPVVASFIVGYSFTLIGSAYDLAPTGPWFAPLIETLLALTIIYLAFENISGWRLDRRVTAFSFGLLQGFGFSFALRNGLQFAGAHMLTAVLSFDAGIIVGHLIVLIALLVGLELLFRIGVGERVGGIILSALAIHPSWHRTAETGAG
ncbi:MAG TPA: HupE/UreJ family protein, partial [Gemmatimonadales bacterium]|nr:HupE/UreJ family protein [Gemmatimonadales bacterium]